MPTLVKRQLEIKSAAAGDDAKVMRVLFDWFKKEANYFTSPFVKQVRIFNVETGTAMESMELYVMEEVRLLGVFSLPIEIKAKLTLDKTLLQIRGVNTTKEFEYVDSTLFISRPAEGVLQITEALDFKLKWMFRLPGLHYLMCKITIWGWTKAHGKMLESMAHTVATRLE